MVIEVLAPVLALRNVGYEVRQGFVNHTLLKIVDGDLLFADGMDREVMFGDR